MNASEKILLDILSSILHKQPIVSEKCSDEQELFEDIKNQSLLPITYSWAKNEKAFSPALKKEWEKFYASQIFRWQLMIREQDQLIRLLSEQGYAAAVMKGNANAYYYPIPQLRGSGDVDILVRWDEYDRIYSLLLEHGYTVPIEKEESKHHFTVSRHKVIFEIHKRPGGTRINSGKNQDKLIAFFQDGLDHVKQTDVAGYTFPVLPDLQNAMVLLLHTAQHMKEGLGLRHILDWMMFAEVVVNDDFWYSLLQPMAQEAHVEILAKTMTRMCQLYLGMSEELTWCRDIPKENCEALMDYLFAQGDFGKKTRDSERGVRVAADGTSLKKLFRHIGESSLYTMPAAKKHPVLKPVAWCYQVLRYIKIVCSRKKSFQTLRQDMDAGAERKKFFLKLGIYNFGDRE